MSLHIFLCNNDCIHPFCCEVFDSHLTALNLPYLLRRLVTSGQSASAMSAAAVRKLAGEVMAFEEGLPADALSTGGPTWPHERRRRWRSLLETTARLPDVSPISLIGQFTCPAELMWWRCACYPKYLLQYKGTWSYLSRLQRRQDMVLSLFRA